MKKAVIISSVVWLTALMGATAWAQDSLYVRQVGQLGSLSVPYCVALEGELACVGDSSYGLRVVDLSNPALPVEIGSLPVGSGAKCIALQDSIVCLSLGANGLRFIDLHNPATPVLLSNYNMTGEARDLVMTDQYVYMVGTSGLRIIDIANMNQPVEVGSFTASVNFRALSVAGNYVYISDIAMGMRIVNVSDPENPTEVGTHIGPGCHDIAIRGNYAFITYNVSVEGQIVVLDITDSTHPEYITRISVGEMATILSLVGDFAYVSGRTISIVDISHPTNPIEVGYYNPGNFLLNQACDEGLLAAVDRTNLRIFSVDVPDTHLTVISPEGEHGWTVNAQDTVRWRSWNYDGPIKIELNRTYPIGTWEVLANYTENDGEQAVWISGGISERCRVRVSAVHDTISDISNADFTIWTAETDSFNVVAVGRLDTIYHATDV
ncbi:MAG: LVIVD repeat-containing protein, partial [Calditrichota bacterium]